MARTARLSHVLLTSRLWRMTVSGDCPLAGTLAQRLREHRNDVAGRWLDRIMDRISLGPDQIFPSRDILDHVPLLIDGIAGYLEDPVEEITIHTAVIDKAMELGAMRHEQGFDAYQILMEYEILGGVLYDFLRNTVDGLDEPCTRSELIVCAHRIFRSVIVIQKYTTVQFLQQAEQRIAEREERLAGFNRAVTHELKNRIGAASGAYELLCEDGVIEDRARVRRMLSIVKSNLDAMNVTLEGLAKLTVPESEAPRPNPVLLADAAAEVRRQLRQFAADRGVDIRIAEDLPRVEVPAAVVELALSNYLSNAIKYRDPTRSDRWARIDASIVTDDDGRRELRVRVSDNGLGVPEESRDRLFQRYFRAHDRSVADEKGAGIGLSLVRDNIEAIGGRVWAEFPHEGSRFGFAIPCHRPPDERTESRA